MLLPPHTLLACARSVSALASYHLTDAASSSVNGRNASDASCNGLQRVGVVRGVQGGGHGRVVKWEGVGK